MIHKIAHITDLHLDEQLPTRLGIDVRKNWNIVLNDLRVRKITHLVLGGDLGLNTMLNLITVKSFHFINSLFLILAKVWLIRNNLNG